MPPRRTRDAVTPRQMEPDARAQSVAERAPVGRGARIPFSGPRGKLDIPVDQQDKNFVYRWMKDDLGRIPDAQRAGYEMVTDPEMASSPQQSDADDMGTAISRLAGKDENGRAQRLYLMRQPREFHEEDQRAKMAEVDAVDRAIMSGDNLKEGDAAAHSQGLTVDVVKIERGV